MIPDPEHLTVAEYAHATLELRVLHSRLVQSELAAVRRELAKLKTLEGKIEQKRQAAITAARYRETARLAALIAGQHVIANRYGDTPEIGAARLEAATAEHMGLTIDEYRRRQKINSRKYAEQEHRAPEPVDPYAGRHGYADTWDEGCRCEDCRRGKRREHNTRAYRRKTAA